MQEAEKSENVGISALMVASGTLSSRILGYVRDMLLGAMFSRTITDAWLVAFRLPNFFRRLLGEGALAVSFIPVFTDLTGVGATEASRAEAKKLVSALYTILLGILITLVTAGIIWVEPIVLALTEGRGFTEVPGKVELTVHLSRIMFVYILLVSLYAYFMAILNSLRQFLLPAFAPVLWNVSMISAALLPLGALSERGDALAWGVVVGGILQVGILIPPLAKAGYLPRISFQFQLGSLRQVFRGLGPSLLGLSVMQVTVLVNTYFAADLPEGANSWIFWADRILELPLSLFAVSIGTALLPTLSSQWNQSRQADFHKTANFYLRSVFFLAIPAAVGVFLLATPIVETLFKYGRFSEDDLQNTSRVLQIYSLAILTGSGVRILAPCFYAIKNTWYPGVCSAIALIFHVGLAWWMVEHYGLSGLVFSTVMSSGLNMIMLFVGYRVWIGPFAYRSLFSSLLRFVIVVAPMAGWILVMQGFVSEFQMDRLMRTLMFALSILGAIPLYFGMAHWLKIEEAHPTTERILRRLRRPRTPKT